MTLTTKDSLAPLKLLLLGFNAASALIVSYLPLYLDDKGLNATEIGLVLAIGPFTAIFAQPFWGYISDKFKTVKKILILCAMILLVSSTIFLHMNSLILLLITAPIFFFVSTPIDALSDSLAQRRAIELNVSFGSIRMFGAFGFAISTLLVGDFLTRIGIQYMIWPYLFFVISSLITTFRLTDVEVSSEPVQISDATGLLKNKKFIIFLLIVIVLMLAHSANDNFLGLYIVGLGGSERWVGFAWFIAVMSEATVYATARYWFRKYHSLIFVISAGILYSIRWFLYAYISSPILVIAFQMLHGLSFGIFYVAAFDYITRLIPRLMHSTGHLVFFAALGIAGIFGSLLGGNIFHAFGGTRLYFVMGCIAVFGTICMFFYHFIFMKKTTFDKQY